MRVVDNDGECAPTGAGVAIVGGGLAGFTAFLTLRHAGVRDVIVFASERDPTVRFARRAAAIRQRAMRSESDGHCFPRGFPGLAAREAMRRRRRPLLGTVTNRYLPTLDWFLRHVRELRGGSGWDEAVVEGRVERVRAVDGGFELDGRGPFRDVLLAPGIRDRRSRPTSRAIRASSTPTSRTVTDGPSPSWVRGWLRPPSG